MCSTPASLPLLDEGADRTLHPLRGPSGEVNVLRLRRKAIASDGKRPLLQETIPCLRSRPYILHILHTRGNKKYQKGRYTIYIYKYLSIATPDPPVSRTARVDLRGTSQEELGHLLSDQPQVTKVSSRRRPTCVPSGALMELWSLQWVVIPLFCCIVLFNFQCAFPLRDSDGDGPCGYFQKKPSMNGTTSTPKWNIA